MNNSDETIFPKGNRGSDTMFTGEVYVKMLVNDEKKVFNTQVYNVEFEPGARTYWHAHVGGQILLVTEGVGYYQEEGKPARKLAKGDVVEIPIGIKHWHGAAPDNHFTHIGMSTRVDEGPAKWLGKVTDKEYSKVRK